MNAILNLMVIRKINFKKVRWTMATAVFCWFFQFANSQDINVPSKITKVTLFMNGANVEREASVNLQGGISTLKFSEITKQLDSKSIQFTGDGNFTILSVKQNTKYSPIENKEKISLASDSLSQLRSELEINAASLSILQEEYQILKKNQPSFSPEFFIKTSELKEVLDFHSTKMADISKKIRESNAVNTKLTQKVNDLNQRLIKFGQNNPKQTTELIVEIMAASSQIANFKITYFTPFASWSPSYDLRVTEIGKPINLMMKANIVQNTDENWEKVHLSVSNGSPTQFESRPVINPWFISYYNTSINQNNNNGFYNPSIRSISGKVTDVVGEALIGASVVISGNNTVGTSTDLDGNYYLPVPYGSQKVNISYVGYESLIVNISNTNMDFILSESHVLMDAVSTNITSSHNRIGGNLTSDNISSRYNSNPLEVKREYKPTSFTYEISHLYTIKSSVKSTQIDLINHEIPAIYSYYAAPKMESSVFLTAGLTDWQEYNLLDGEINLYLEGSYLGKSTLDTQSETDTIHISLGRDKGVVIARESIKEYNKKSFLGNKRTISKAYEITVRNNKHHAIDLKIQDNIPISMDNEIEVNDISFDKGKMDNETKIVTWQFSIPPKSGEKTTLKYSVKFPAKKRVDVE